jgi:hypothetical protein
MLGAQGTIIWDEDSRIVGPDGEPGPRGALFAPMWREQTGALGAQLLEAKPAAGQVAILYSQASFRMTWPLDRRPGGDAWVERDAEAEGADNPWRAATRRAARALAGLGAQPRWITPETLSAGELTRDGTRVLVLPHSIALSNEEVAAVRGFAEAGGLILADVPPGERGIGRPPMRPVQIAQKVAIHSVERVASEHTGHELDVATPGKRGDQLLRHALYARWMAKESIPMHDAGDVEQYPATRRSIGVSLLVS